MQNGLNANVTTMTQAEKTLLRYQYVMANTADAQGDFADTADNWANRMRLLNQQLQAFGAIVGEVFVNALKPALRAMNSFMDSVIKFARTVADALGAIFGWTIEIDNVGVLDDAGDYAEDLASGLGGASGKAKELKRQLQGFDELNVLTTDTPSSGGGGGGGSTGSNSGGANTELVKTESAIDKYKSEIDSLFGLGEYIGDTITNELNSIDWDEAYQGAKDFGTGLADFLNGLISPDLFGAVGKTIAGSLNTSIRSALALGINFDGINFGESIATGINEFFAEFDFGQLAKTLNVWVDNLFDTLTSAVSNVKWGDVLQTAIEGLTELDIDTVAFLVGTIAWKHGGKEITNTLLTKLLGAKIGTSQLSLSRTLGLSLGVAVIGFKIGNMLYDHIPAIQEWADSLVEWMFGGDDTINIDRAITVTLSALTLSIASGKLVGNLVGGALAGGTLASAGTLGTAGALGTGSLLGGKLIGKAFPVIAALYAGKELGDLGSMLTNEYVLSNIARMSGDEELAKYYKEYSGWDAIATASSDLIDYYAGETKEIKKENKEMLANAEARKKTVEQMEAMSGIFKTMGGDYAELGEQWNTLQQSFYDTDSVEFSQNAYKLLGDTTKKIFADTKNGVVDTKNKVSDTLYNLGQAFYTAFNNAANYATDGNNKITDSATETSADVTKTYSTLNTNASNSFRSLATNLNSRFGEISSNTKKSANDMYSAFDQGARGINTRTSTLLRDVNIKLRTASWYGSGQDLVRGLSAGIETQWQGTSPGSLVYKVGILAKNLTEKIKGFFGIHSPSKVWEEEIGLFLPPGIANGIEKAEPELLRTVDSLGLDMTNRMSNLIPVSVNPFEQMQAQAEAIKSDINGKMTASISSGNITADISSSMSQSQSEQNAILREQNEILMQILQKETGINAKDIFDSVRSQNRQYFNQTGRNAFVY